MTRQVIFIQGAGEGAHAEDAKLAASLGKALGSSYSIRYPDVPNEDAPDFELWKRSTALELDAMGERPIVVAHSAGAAMVVMWLAEGREPIGLGGVFLIAAPYFGEGGWESADAVGADGLETALSTEIPLHFYHGTKDEIVPFAHLALYEKAVPRATVHPLKGRDHQLNEDLSEVARDIAKLEAGKA